MAMPFVPRNKYIDLTGQRFTSLVAVRLVGRDRHGFLLWLCKCDCGNETTTTTGSLRGGNTKSCGCRIREISRKLRLTHGRTRTPEYRAWYNIRKRCSDPKRHRYAGIGITVCERWRQSFENFFADMGARPPGEYSIDRINNKGGYWCGKPECPECGPPGRTPNCRWATRREQGGNKEVTVFIEFGGERMCLADWARRIGICTASLRQRLRTWPLARALTEAKHFQGAPRLCEPFLFCG